MNTERDKFLTEAIGECWHIKMFNYTQEQYIFTCGKCGDRFDKDCYNNFSTWEGFGKLWEFVQYEKWYNDFSAKLNYSTESVRNCYINPDKFATAVYKYLYLKENL